jgi:hypothetical protein
MMKRAPRSSRQRSRARGGVATCVPVTVNVVPQQKLDDAASQIVDMSRRPERAAATAPAPSATPSPGRASTGGLPAGPRDASAQGSSVDIARRPRRMAKAPPADEVTEPQLGARQRANAWLRRREQPGVRGAAPARLHRRGRRLIGEENRDRQAIIETFMRQNRLRRRMWAGEGVVRQGLPERTQRAVDPDRPGNWVKK